MKRNLATCFLIVALLSLAGCREFKAKATYFDGAVLAEYHQLEARGGSNDSFTLTFYETGTYYVAFSQTPGKSDRGIEYMPQNFTIVINSVPRLHVISQYILPGFLRATITYGGKTETHDFH